MAQSTLEFRHEIQFSKDSFYAENLGPIEGWIAKTFQASDRSCNRTLVHLGSYTDSGFL